VIFFGLLASQASASADAVAPKVRTDLQEAGVPVSAQDRIVEAFKTCFRDQTAEKDPSVVPPSCQQTQNWEGPAALPRSAQRMEHATIVSAAVEAREHDFTASIERTLYWEVGAFLAVFLLVFLLPERPRPQTFEQPPVKATEIGGR
jgi:hypothetical protein